MSQQWALRPVVHRTARGFTLAEALLSLALLAGLATAIASWTVATARGVAHETAPLAWRAAADAVLDRIGRDIDAADFVVEDEDAGPRARRARDQEPPPLRASFKEGVLSIETRAAGPCVRRYEVEDATGTLVAREVRPEGRRKRDEESAERPRLLMTGVAEIACELDEKARTLRVEIVASSPRGGEDDRTPQETPRAARSYRVP